MNKNYALIIGAMKSGTTSLYEYLCSNPEICRCKTKEPNFFIDKNENKKDKKVYSDLWNFNPRKNSYCLEASTGYTKYPFNKGVPYRIKKYGIKPKFLYIVRNPVERIESHYNFLRISKSTSVSGFTDRRLIEVSKYFKQMERFLRVFPNKERYKIVNFKRFIEDHKRVLEECKKFLGIKGDFKYEEIRPQNKTPRRKTDLWISRMGNIKNIIGKMFSEGQRKKIKRFIGMFSPRTEYVKMKKSDRITLKNMLREDMHKFENEFNFDVSKWGF